MYLNDGGLLILGYDKRDKAKDIKKILDTHSPTKFLPI